MRRWENCIVHRNDEATDFVSTYFSQPDRVVLLVASAGFDPRSAVLTELIAKVCTERRGIYVREERPNADPELRRRADANADNLAKLMPGASFLPIHIFDPQDGAVVGARRLIRAISPLVMGGKAPTDVVLDLSAFSIGISFPLVRYFYEQYGCLPESPNIHLFVTEDTKLDSGITPEHTEQAMYVPGFDGGAGLDGSSKSVRLWIPQLVKRRNTALARIHTFVRTTETCPILPFPAGNLRRGDELLESYNELLTSAWEVDPRSYIYAAESEPLDLYRTLLRLDDARKKVFEYHGGSMLVLSPVGSKVLALGALLAALERDFPVAYLESISYAFDAEKFPENQATKWPMVHLWLSGEGVT